MRQQNKNWQSLKQPINKRWWFWLLVVIFFPFFCLYGIYKLVAKYKTTRQKRWLIGIAPLAFVSLIGFSFYAAAIANSKPTNQPKEDRVTRSSSTSKETAKDKASVSKETSATTASHAPKISENELLTKLLEYTNTNSPGPTKNYYWENGPANLTGFEHLKAGEHQFDSDTLGRSATARAILTYAQYQASKGARQGQPLDPPNWPDHNPKIGITFSLTGKTYHGYQYNRSHSIADSLLGKDSYTSKYNFTTGTRSQNVGANQNGGMRFAEETAEKYWHNHPDTQATISYQTTPIYNANETIPRGSKVDMKSSDGVLDVEIIVINSAEGLTIDYGTNTPTTSPVPSTTPVPATSDAPVSAEPAPEQITPPVQTAPQPAPPVTDYTTSGNWSIAAPGMVFISEKNKYYRQVTNPSNYSYKTQDEAIASGATQGHGNGSARP